MSLIVDVVTEVMKTKFKGIGKQQMRLTKKLTEHVNNLTEAIWKVWDIVEAETYGVDLHDTLKSPLLFALLKIEFKSQALETWTQEYDDVVHEFGTLSMDFSKLSLVEVYANPDLCRNITK